MGKDKVWDESNINDYPDYDEPGQVSGVEDDEVEPDFDPEGEDDGPQGDA